jgi:Trk-type K+ transport system membrane component
MMYIGSYPVVLLLRASAEDVWQADTGPRQADAATLRAHACILIFRDAAFLFLGYFVICLIETTHIDESPSLYSLFNILFEVISAYGTFGLSMTPRGAAVSLSSYFYTGSKVVVCALMMLGRHRGLPQALDAAIVFKRAARIEVQLKERQSVSLDLVATAQPEAQPGS